MAAGKTIGQVAQALEISEQTFHRWRNQYGGMKAEEAKRLKELDQENKRLKSILRSIGRHARNATKTHQIAVMCEQALESEVK